jgi:hypothetical protein
MKIRISIFTSIIIIFSVVLSTGQNILVSKISEDSGIHTDRRPISVGFYDSAVNKTFISWMGSYSDAVVKAYDHTSQKWSDDKIVGESPFADSHNYPGMVQMNDGRILVVYGCHNSVMRVTTSPMPSSIDGKWNDGDLAGAQGASYPVPIVTSDGTIYCFYRITMRNIYPNESFPTDYRPYGFVKSTDNGNTWELAVKFIDNYPRSDNLCEIYNGKISYQAAGDSTSERIHIAWSISGGGPDNHQHGLYRRHVYYAYLDPSNYHLYDIKGNDLGLEIDDSEAETFCKVISTGTPPEGEQVGYQTSVHFNDNGTPLIIYQHEGLKCAYWSGSVWSVSTISSQSSEPREIEKIGEIAFRVYRTSGSSVYVYKTSDGGINWEQEDRIITPAPVRRCYVINNYHDDVKLLLSEAVEDGNNVGIASRDVFIGRALDATSIEDIGSPQPFETQLAQNYPNPFNPTTVISWQLSVVSNVQVTVYNTIGQKVATLLSEKQEAGYHQVKWDASQFAAGIYFYKIEAAEFKQVRKMIYIK